MKIALCQINQTVGKLDTNREKIIAFYKKSLSKGSQLTVFPELAVSGYPPQDLLYEKSFIEKSMQSLDKISDVIGNTPIIIGHVLSEFGSLFNTASIIQNGRIVGQHKKILLPNYDIFDERRYFRPGKESIAHEIVIDGTSISIGLQICEDLWDDRYKRNITKELVQSGSDLIINISASPFSVGKSRCREKLIREKVLKYSLPFLYCNLVGGQDELIFDGNSISFSSSGIINAKGKSFSEDIVIVDLENNNHVSTSEISKEEEIFMGLKLGIKDYFYKTKHTNAIIGLSGGIDSALTACLASESIGRENVLCVYMPTRYSSKHSMIDSKSLASRLGVSYKILPIDDLFSQYEKFFENEFRNLPKDVTEENIQARIRSNLLMSFSNKLDYLVLSTSNKTELALGYCTLYGDMSGSLAAISDLHKNDVYKLGKWYNKSMGESIIPERTFTKSPSAELNKDQKDPFNYKIVSPLVREIIENERTTEDLIEIGYDQKLIKEIKKLIKNSEFKRKQASPGLRISNKAFGIGRRYPIVNGSKD